MGENLIDKGDEQGEEDRQRSFRGKKRGEEERKMQRRTMKEGEIYLKCGNKMEGEIVRMGER